LHSIIVTQDGGKQNQQELKRRDTAGAEVNSNRIDRMDRINFSYPSESMFICGQIFLNSVCLCDEKFLDKTSKALEGFRKV
jgi:hypothetical protein